MLLPIPARPVAQRPRAAPSGSDGSFCGPALQRILGSAGQGPPDQEPVSFFSERGSRPARPGRLNPRAGPQEDYGLAGPYPCCMAAVRAVFRSPAFRPLAGGLTGDTEHRTLRLFPLIHIGTA